MHEIITADYYEGQGCTCYATSANECGCEGADWTPTEVYKLREDAKQLADRLTALELHSTSELARLERERNEAQEKYATEATEHMLAVNKICNERDEALSQIAQAECRAERFCQERDELIDKNKKLNEEVDDLIRQRPLLIEDFKRERDEARDALMKIEDLFIDGTDIYADREKMGMIAREALEDEK
jgi:chromosome segregation ATPase